MIAVRGPGGGLFFRPPTDDEEALALLGQEGDPVSRAVLPAGLLSQGRGAVIIRAVERGLLQPDALFVGQPLVHLAGRHNPKNATSVLRHLLVLERGVDPDCQAGDGDAVLHAVLRHKCEEAALFLINEAPGCGIEARGAGGLTPLIIAAAFGMTTEVETLVDKGVNLEAVNDDSRNAFVHALATRAEDCALRLMEAGISWFGTVELDGETMSLLEISAGYDCARIVKAILRRMRAAGVAQAELFESMQTAAGHAVRNGSLLALRTLVEEGLDVKAAGCVFHGGGQPSLGLLNGAARVGLQEMVRFLIEQGCSAAVSTTDAEFSPHYMAALKGHSHIYC